MPSFRFYPRTPKAKKSSIQLRIRSGSAGGNSAKIGTGIVIENPVKSWDKKNDRLHRSYGNSQPINMKLAEIRAKAEELYYHAKATRVNDPIAFTKEQLIQSLLGGSTTSPTGNGFGIRSELLLELFDRFCDAKRDEYATSTLKSYGTTRMHLADFDSKTGTPSLANGVDMDWVDSFRRYLRKRGLTDNSLRRSLKILKTCLRWADDRGYLTDQAYIKAIKLGKERATTSIALTKEQLGLIENADLSKRPKLDRIRWWFIAQCCTGVRFSDLNQVIPEHVHEGKLHIQPVKTKDQAISILVRPQLQRAFDHLGDSPLDFSSQHYNRMLKEIGRHVELNDTIRQTFFSGNQRIEKSAPLHDCLTSHTARRTFITILLREGESRDTVMKLSGHEDERSFSKYVKLTEEDTAKAMEAVFD